MSNKPLFIIQSNYIPWKGYFLNIAKSAEVLILDDVQYTRRDWRNRNQIKTHNGLKWLTISVDNKDKYGNQRICDTQISDRSWSEKHWGQIAQNYKAAPFYREISDFLRPLYLKANQHTLLSEINLLFIREICALLNIDTKITKSTDYFSLTELTNFQANGRLIKLCMESGHHNYLSSELSKAYLDLELFKQHNIEIKWVDYSSFQPYLQLHGEFTHNVSIIDTLMMVGKDETEKIIKNGTYS